MLWYALVVLSIFAHCTSKSALCSVCLGHWLVGLKPLRSASSCSRTGQERVKLFHFKAVARVLIVTLVLPLTHSVTLRRKIERDSSRIKVPQGAQLMRDLTS